MKNWLRAFSEVFGGAAVVITLVVMLAWGFWNHFWMTAGILVLLVVLVALCAGVVERKAHLDKA